jgi:hypothetical protein
MAQVLARPAVGPVLARAARVEVGRARVAAAARVRVAEVPALEVQVAAPMVVQAAVQVVSPVALGAAPNSPRRGAADWIAPAVITPARVLVVVAISPVKVETAEVILPEAAVVIPVAAVAARALLMV